MITNYVSNDKLEDIFDFISNDVNAHALLSQTICLSPDDNLHLKLNSVHKSHFSYFRKFNSIDEMIFQFNWLSDGGYPLMCLTKYGGRDIFFLLKDDESLCIVTEYRGNFSFQHYQLYNVHGEWSYQTTNTLSRMSDTCSSLDKCIGYLNTQLPVRRIA